MSPSSTNVAPSSPQKRVLRIYIDNSNIFIEGKKAHAEQTGAAIDPFWRIDFGKLGKVLHRESMFAPDGEPFEVYVNLYGSTPPNSDSLWDAMRAHNVHVETYDRQGVTGKEKRVDTNIVADMVEQAADDQAAGIKAGFVLLSGDLDFHPTVEKIQRRGFPFQLWSWKHCLARRYTNLGGNLFTLHYLDDYLHEFSFREMRTPDPCRWGYSCTYFPDCWYSHTMEEEAYLAYGPYNLGGQSF
ncbi:hypothetical protein BU26DRAFT_596330 [Trematosphaeria pertusa]|uniref:NYN domain-containing protein n=1 Tax=Trematosphaeria pertusa TaxID=390896 RepID=A0A6A6IES0_9PLEO|nr:uncharacterized protein BU26DRAFT_596330 [Trematosphaeria pertusa]KAF2248402.1 hypothetical protein BU26DRAFT_596330 [Trematosphaeria pertusa]